VVRDEGTLRAAWAQATSKLSLAPPVPVVDFTREMVVLVGAGRMTTEDEIRVDSTVVQQIRTPSDEVESVLGIIVRTTKGCGRFDVEGYPLQIVRVRAFPGDVRWIERNQQADCW
jgi:hypothetical protein